MNKAFEETFPKDFDGYKTLYEDLYTKNLCVTHETIKATCTNDG